VRRDSAFFDARRLRPGQHSRRQGIYGWNWRTHAARTVVWGLTGRDVRHVTIIRPAGRLNVRREPSGAFTAVLPATVDPHAISVELRLANGHTVTNRAPYNLGPVPPKR
jgi:hypothetical protein